MLSDGVQLPVKDAAPQFVLGRAVGALVVCVCVCVCVCVLGWGGVVELGGLGQPGLLLHIPLPLTVQV